LWQPPAVVYRFFPVREPRSCDMCKGKLAKESAEAGADAGAAKAARKAARLAASAAAEEAATAEELDNKKMKKKKKQKLAEEEVEQVVDKTMKKKQHKVADEEVEQASDKKKEKKNKLAEVEPDQAPKKRNRDTNAEQATDNPKKKKKEAKEQEEDSGGASSSSGTSGARAYRDAHNIIVDNGCPAPMETFAEAKTKVGKALYKALLAQGYVEPTPIQAQAWPIALEGRDMVAVAKTGSGKTCGFLLPALVRVAERGPAPLPKRHLGYSDPAQPRILVLAPTRELAQQIAVDSDKFAPAVNAKTVCVFGGMPKSEQVNALCRGCDVLVATPGRLLDLGGFQDKESRPFVKLDDVSYLVLDEADKMLEMGFEEDIRTIVKACKSSGQPEEAWAGEGPHAGTRRQTLFFTATWPKEVQKTAKDLTAPGVVQIRIGQGCQGDKLTLNTSIKQDVRIIREEDKQSALLDILKNDFKEGETGLIFCSMKSRCDELSTAIRNCPGRLFTQVIHSDKTQRQRDFALQHFRDLTAGNIKGFSRGVLIATDVAARGLDIPGVAVVVVYDFGRALNSGVNGGVEAFVHRVGRTGRAGKSGRAYTFFTEQDAGGNELIKLLQDAGQSVPEGLEDLAATEAERREAHLAKKSYYKRGKGGKGKGKDKGKGKGKGKGRGYS